MSSVGRVDTAVTRLHMLICCTCGSGIGELWWSELPPTHFHPIPFIPTECGSPFTLLSQRRQGGKGGERRGSRGRGWRRRRDGRRRGRDGGLRGREVVFLFFLAQREGKTIGVQMDASPLFLDDPPLPLPRPSILSSIPPFCTLRMFRKRDPMERRATG